MYTYIHTCIHIYTYIYMYMHIYIYIYTYMIKVGPLMLLRALFFCSPLLGSRRLKELLPFPPGLRC